MKFNPLDKLVEHSMHKASQEAWEQSNWGTQLTFPVNRTDGQELVFQLRMPDGLELVDVIELAQAARGAPVYVGTGLAALEQARQVPGVIVVGAMRGDGVPEAEREVLAAVTVTFIELHEPFDVEQFMPNDTPNTIKSQQDHVEVSGNITRIHRISAESQGDGGEPLPMLLIEYLWRSEYGLVTIAFSTSRMDMMSAKARDLFDLIRQTAYIGERTSVID